MACDRFLKQPSDDFFAFCQENDWWLGNYALFMVIKNMHKGASWLQWEEKYKRRDFAALDQVWHGQHDEIQFYQFQQYLFCLLYTSDASDEEDSVEIGGRRIHQKKKTK